MQSIDSAVESLEDSPIAEGNPGQNSNRHSHNSKSSSISGGGSEHTRYGQFPRILGRWVSPHEIDKIKTLRVSLLKNKPYYTQKYHDEASTTRVLDNLSINRTDRRIIMMNGC